VGRHVGSRLLWLLDLFVRIVMEAERLWGLWLAKLPRWAVPTPAYLFIVAEAEWLSDMR
jgi:hypothetical protein